MKKFYLMLLSLVIMNFCTAQEAELIKYLDAYKTKEFEESQTLISQYSFGQIAKYTLMEYSPFSGIAFNTDMDSIKGYKAIGNCKMKNEAGGFVEKRMMVVMYFDKIQKHWSVFSFREVADSKHEYEMAKLHVDKNDFYTDKEFVYRSLSYWALMAGHLQEAKTAIKQAIEAAKTSKSKHPFSPEEMEFTLQRVM